MAVDGSEPADQKPLPPGVVLGKDGKPCRTCSSGAAFAAFASKAKTSSSSSNTSSNTSSSSSSSLSSSSGAIPAAAALGATATTAAASAASLSPRQDCPPDVEELGRSTWTLLHSMAAAYPARASAREQADVRAFLGLFARLYPCWSCAADFERYLQSERPLDARRDLAGRAEFGRWLCDAHNAVNRKLGKKAFDCARWEERWRDGWKDGRCD